MINSIIMKKVLVLLFISLTAVLPTRSQNLVTAEYYYDTDPGVGNGIPISIIAGDSVTKTFTFDVSGLDPGFHNLFIRVRDNLGRWSLVRRHLFHVYDDALIDLTVEEPVLTGFEYFYNQDPGFGNGIWVAATEGGNIEETINFSTVGLDPGFHQIMVRARDASGKWGQYSRGLFYVFDDTHIDLTRKSSKI